MAPTAIDSLMEEHRAVDAILRSQGELSRAISLEILFKRAFVVASGSYCEEQLTDILEAFAARHRDARLTVFVRKRALDRKYHDLFDWSVLNANRFWGFFGEDFKDDTLAALKENEEAARSMRSFVQLGQLRNLVAHGFAKASVDRTVDELETLAREALMFVSFVAGRLGLGAEEAE